MAPVRLPTPSSLRPLLLVVVGFWASSSLRPQALVLPLLVQQVLCSVQPLPCVCPIAVLISRIPSILWFSNHAVEYAACSLYCLHVISSHATCLGLAMRVVDECGRGILVNCLLVQATPPLGHLQEVGHPRDLGSSLRRVSRSVCQRCMALYQLALTFNFE